MTSARNGYALDVAGRVWRTRDGGRRWAELPAVGTGAGLALAFGSAAAGYLTLRTYPADGGVAYVLRTSDGGRHWRPQRIAAGAFAAGAGVVAPAAGRAFALTSTPAAGDGVFRSLFATTSGGDAGPASTVTLTTARPTLARPGRVTVDGVLRGAQGGESVVVASRSAGGRWREQVVTVGANGGRFTAALRVTAADRDRRALGRGLGPAGRGLGAAAHHAAALNGWGGGETGLAATCQIEEGARTAFHRPPKGTRHAFPRHDRPRPRLLGDPPQLGALDRRTTRPRGYRVLAPAYPGFEVEVEALNADPTPIVERHRPGDHRALRVGDPRARRRRRSSSATRPAARSPRSCSTAATAPPASRSTRRPTEGVPVVPLSQVQVDVPGPEEPGQPPQGRRLHLRAVALRVHQHASPRTARARSTSATPSRPPGASCGTASWPTSSPATRTRGSTTTTTTARRCCSSRRPRTTSCRPRSSGRTPSTTSPTRSPRSRSSRARTCCPRQEGWEEIADHALDWALRARRAARAA